jgi:hypothetical protein
VHSIFKIFHFLIMHNSRNRAKIPNIGSPKNRILWSKVRPPPYWKAIHSVPINDDHLSRSKHDYFSIKHRVYLYLLALHFWYVKFSYKSALSIAEAEFSRSPNFLNYICNTQNKQTSRRNVCRNANLVGFFCFKYNLWLHKNK